MQLLNSIGEAASILSRMLAPAPPAREDRVLDRIDPLAKRARREMNGKLEFHPAMSVKPNPAHVC